MRDKLFFEWTIKFSNIEFKLFILENVIIVSRIFYAGVQKNIIMVILCLTFTDMNCNLL